MFEVGREIAVQIGSRRLDLMHFIFIESRLTESAKTKDKAERHNQKQRSELVRSGECLWHVLPGFARFILRGEAGPRSCVLIHHILAVMDGQDLLSVKPHVDKRLVLGRKPEAADSPILAHKVRAGDPERERLGRTSGDSDNRVVLGVDPDSTRKQILVFTLRNGFGTASATRQ